MLPPAETKMLAVGVLAVMGVVLTLVIVRALRHSPYRPAQSIVLAWARITTRILWRARVSGPLPIPPGQGAVIVSNHRCPFDPAFMTLAVDRIMHWMVAKEYCEHPLMGLVLRIFEPIPTNRGGVDTAATKLTIRYAQQGEIVGLFPEGRLNTTRQFMLPGRPGVAMIALRSRVPVIPCYIEGSPYNGTTLGCLLMPAKVRLVVGLPIDLSPYYDRDNDREVLEDLTARFMREIAALAGRPDYEPVVAGHRQKPL
ncbi:MAG: lysophospholipid acyltransferase family protein [Planctomycetia bacterium]|nr:lysophospholipid acyltransferase family protein [Planctomycetia bacterium]